MQEGGLRCGGVVFITLSQSAPSARHRRCTASLPRSIFTRVSRRRPKMQQPARVAPQLGQQMPPQQQYSQQPQQYTQPQQQYMMQPQQQERRRERRALRVAV